jgi:hypothetical protein
MLKLTLCRLNWDTAGLIYDVWSPITALFHRQALCFIKRLYADRKPNKL